MTKAKLASIIAAGCLMCAAPALAQPYIPLYNPDLEIESATAPRPAGWRLYNAAKYRKVGDGLLPTTVTRSGTHSILLPDAVGSPNEFMAVQAEEYRDPNDDPFTGRNWPEYNYNPPNTKPLTVSCWFNIPASNPLSAQRFGLHLRLLRSGLDFSAYQEFEWWDVDPDAAVAYPGCTIVTLPSSAKGIHTNGQWVKLSRTITQADIGSFASPPTNPARVSIFAQRFGASTAPGTVWVDDLAFSQVNCPADFDGSGGLSPADIFAFLNAYFAGNPAADFNNDGSRTPADIFAFLNAYFAGCPAS